MIAADPMGTEPAIAHLSLIHGCTIMAFDREDTLFFVVVNHEEQYSIWPGYRDVPAGWTPIGEPRPKAECLAYIDEVWTDMRPLSLRRHMEEQERSAPARS